MSTIIKMEHYMPELDRKRMLRIYLPTGYEYSNQSYPVVYMHDAQNLYELESAAYGMIWDIKTVMDQLGTELNSKFIVVGIDNAEGDDRLDEYSPWVNTSLKDTMDRFRGSNRDYGGLGQAYGAYIVNTLKPYIDKKYRTLVDPENTSIIGSSMGGIISLYIGMTYPHIFSKIGAFSTASWFCQEELEDFMKKVDLNQRVYLDIGTKETSDPTVEEFAQMYVDGSKRLYECLLATGIDETNVKLVVEEGADHSEISWARRFPAAFKWLYKL